MAESCREGRPNPARADGRKAFSFDRPSKAAGDHVSPDMPFGSERFPAPDARLGANAITPAVIAATETEPWMADRSPTI